MNTHTLENEILKVSVLEKGAELSSMVNQETGYEYIWQGSDKFWSRHSPLLFPNVGKQFLMRYTYNGKEYSTNQHGFARDKDFTLKKSSKNSLQFYLGADEQSRSVYPFEFELYVDYLLEDKTLTITWTVNNNDSKEMYFTIGGHPAFNTVPEKNEHFLYFPNTTQLVYSLLDPETGTVLDKKYTVDLDNGYLPLKNSMFEEDAWIFDDGQISECSVTDKDKNPIISVISEGFPNYGIWSIPEAPYICLEPWDGRADNYGFNEDISKKPGIITLSPGESYSKSYQIKVS